MLWMEISKPAVACIMFFSLDGKEPKDQDKPDPSGRFVGPSRTWVETYRFGLSTLLSLFVERYFQMLLLSV